MVQAANNCLSILSKGTAVPFQVLSSSCHWFHNHLSLKDLPKLPISIIPSPPFCLGAQTAFQLTKHFPPISLFVRIPEEIPSDLVQPLLSPGTCNKDKIRRNFFVDIHKQFSAQAPGTPFVNHYRKHKMQIGYAYASWYTQLICLIYILMENGYKTLPYCPFVIQNIATSSQTNKNSRRCAGLVLWLYISWFMTVPASTCCEHVFPSMIFVEA